MALARARFAHNQRIGPFGDELQGVQLKARGAGYLGVKASPLQCSAFARQNRKVTSSNASQ
jgi:hypothetical protein